jgi:four helix bundle protein
LKIVGSEQWAVKVKNYSELIAWQKAMDLAEAVYRATENLPRQELYGLTSQLRRAAVSVPSNIAEGQGRSSTAEFVHRLSIAHGSLREVETQILLAGRLGMINKENLETLMDRAAEVGRLINGLRNSLARKLSAHRPLLTAH